MKTRRSRLIVFVAVLVAGLGLASVPILRSFSTEAVPGSSIQFHTTADDASYQDLRFKVITAAEGSVKCPYADSKGIPTIGLGFNLRIDKIRTQVLSTLVPGGLTDDELAQLQTVLSATWKPYTKCDDGNKLMTALNQKMALFSLTNPALPSTLNYPTTAAMEDTFNIAAATYEDRLTSWLSGIPNSLERVALFSLCYNGVLGPHLQADLVNGDRAAAWYEIRYGTTAENDSTSKYSAQYSAAGMVKRRDFESDLFGLYNGSAFAADPAPIDDTAATQVMTMVTNNQTQMYPSVVPDGSGLFNNRYFVDPNSDDATATGVAGNEVGSAADTFADAISAAQTVDPSFGVRNLDADIAPAVAHLSGEGSGTASPAPAVETVLVPSSVPSDGPPSGTATPAAAAQAIFVPAGASAATLTLGVRPGLLYARAGTSVVLGAGVQRLTLAGGAFTVDATAVDPTAAPILAVDAITFDGAPLAGSVTSGVPDATGRTVELDGTTLVVTGPAPAGGAPASPAPGGAKPDAAAPAGATPTDSASVTAIPSGAVPSSAVPGSAVPGSAVPSLAPGSATPGAPSPGSTALTPHTPDTLTVLGFHNGDYGLTVTQRSADLDASLALGGR